MPLKYAHRAVLGTQRLITGAVCNQCGQEVNQPDHASGEYQPAGVHRFKVSGGYDSSYPRDSEHVEFVLCDGCLKALTEGFKIPPQSLSYGQTYEIQLVLHTELQKELVLDYPYVWKNVEAIGPNKLDAQALEAAEFGHFAPGNVWKHYKGNLYTVIGDALFVKRNVHTGTEYEVLRIYRPLYGEDRLFARPVGMWRELVLDPLRPGGWKRAPDSMGFYMLEKDPPHKVPRFRELQAGDL